MFLYLLESPQRDDSNKYLNHMFYEEMITKQDLSYVSICSLSILYKRKFILMATSLGRNGAAVTKVLYSLMARLIFISEREVGIGADCVLYHYVSVAVLSGLYYHSMEGSEKRKRPQNRADHM